MSVKFGLTEKERILQLAADGDDDAAGPFTSERDEDAVIKAALKRGPEFFAAVDVTQRPIAPFINRPKLPRVLRQKVLDKLTGQHLAMAAALAGTAAATPAAAAADAALLERAVKAAVEQEADIYGRCASSQAYQNMASRSSAVEWRSDVRAAAEATVRYQELLRAQAKEEQERERAKKRQKTGMGKARGGTAAATAPAAATEPPPPSEVGLKEADLDWASAEPDPADVAAVKRLRRRVLAALEACGGWAGLSAEQRVSVADRCTQKVRGSGAPVNDKALQRLAEQYIRFTVGRRQEGAGM